MLPWKYPKHFPILYPELQFMFLCLKLKLKTLKLYYSLRWYGTLNMDQKVCLNMVKKDQLCAIALKKRN